MEKPMKVLIVEDEQLIAMCLKLDIEDIGVMVLPTVSNGKDSIEIANKENPDLILMDINLPGGMDGIEAAEQILLQKKVPVAFMTGFATDMIKRRAQKLNPVAYLNKPVDIDRVKQIIETLKTD